MRLYEILGLDSNASKEEIKKAYRSLSKQHHPDKGGDPEAFQSITEAYEILSDDEKREHYDTTGDIESIQSVSEVLRNMLFSYIDRSVNSFGFVPDHVDLVGAIRGRINDDIRREFSKIEETEKDIRHTEGTLKNVLNGDLLKSYLQTQIKVYQKRIESSKKEIERLNQCLNEIKEWEYGFSEDSEPIGLKEIRNE